MSDQRLDTPLTGGCAASPGIEEIKNINSVSGDAAHDRAPDRGCQQILSYSSRVMIDLDKSHACMKI